MTRLPFPVGYRTFHSEPSTNYQLNRWLPGADEASFVKAAMRLQSLRDWKPVMLELAESAAAEGRDLHASTCYRAAEFFMDVDDPERLAVYAEYERLFCQAFGNASHRLHDIEFEGGRLAAVHFPSIGKSRGMLVIHGGFDSCYEEFWVWGPHFTELGYEVVIFEGPGQGGALRKHGLKLRLEWEVPTAAVLDHFRIDTCTLLGVSLGGLLALRAAAFEPRVSRVAALDVMFDRYDCFAHANGAEQAHAIKRLLDAGARQAVEQMMAGAMKASEATAWAIRQGLWTSGCKNVFDYVQWVMQFRAEPFSHRVTQDVLLMAGSNDHLVPKHQFFQQGASLARAKSLQMRMFTEHESGQSHCQVGNIGLVLHHIELWLAGLEQRDAHHRG